MIDTKTCAACGEDYPATPEYFYRASKGAGGLQAKCKACHRVQVSSADLTCQHCGTRFHGRREQKYKQSALICELISLVSTYAPLEAQRFCVTDTHDTTPSRDQSRSDMSTLIPLVAGQRSAHTQ